MTQENDALLITQPWNDHRIKIGSVYIGCGTKENADYIMSLQPEKSATDGGLREPCGYMDRQQFEQLIKYKDRPHVLLNICTKGTVVDPVSLYTSPIHAQQDGGVREPVGYIPKADMEYLKKHRGRTGGIKPIIRSLLEDGLVPIYESTTPAQQGGATPTGQQLYTMVSSRFKAGQFPWSYVSENGKDAWNAAASDLMFSPDTILAQQADGQAEQPGSVFRNNKLITREGDKELFNLSVLSGVYLEGYTILPNELYEQIQRMQGGCPTAQLKDHVIAHMINRLRDVAVRFHDTQQLRERIAGIVLPIVRDVKVTVTVDDKFVRIEELTKECESLSKMVQELDVALAKNEHSPSSYDPEVITQLFVKNGVLHANQETLHNLPDGEYALVRKDVSADNVWDPIERDNVLDSARECGIVVQGSTISGLEAALFCFYNKVTKL